MTTADRPCAGLLDIDPLRPAGLEVLSPGERRRSNGICFCLDRAGELPTVDPADFDVLLTTAAQAPPPWVCCPAPRIDGQVALARRRVADAPFAAATLARLLRLTQSAAFEEAIEIESLAYSMLLGGGEFRRWLAQRGPADTAPEGARVEYARDGGCVTLTIAAPDNRNAMTAALRDALFEALANVLEDPSRPALVLRAQGRCFSTGGDLAEFGAAGDLAQAHAIRTARSCAALLHRLGDRASVRVHGACIGSGIEIAAAAHRRVGADDAFVQLPELAMGLIPGAGGTVSLPRAIGRHRTAWLALSGLRIGAARAREWGVFGAAPR